MAAKWYLTKTDTHSGFAAAPISCLGLMRVSFTTSLMSGFTRSPEPSLLLRRQYLQSLEEPQEFFLEELVESGQFWTQEDGSYGVINGNVLVEFFSADPTNSKRLLSDFRDLHGFSTALVKSYDRHFVRPCEELGWTGSVGGFLFRKREPRDQIAFPNAEMRAAKPTDLAALWAINDGFFASEGEIAGLAESDKLWTVRVDGRVAGCGVSNRFIKDCEAVDVGMLVAKGFRQRGLGTYIVSEIANRIERKGLRPICGCGARNLASKATLERAGFVSDHQFLSFEAR